MVKTAAGGAAVVMKHMLEGLLGWPFLSLLWRQFERGITIKENKYSN